MKQNTIIIILLSVILLFSAVTASCFAVDFITGLSKETISLTKDNIDEYVNIVIKFSPLEEESHDDLGYYFYTICHITITPKKNVRFEDAYIDCEAEKRPYSSGAVRSLVCGDQPLSERFACKPTIKLDNNGYGEYDLYVSYIDILEKSLHPYDVDLELTITNANGTVIEK